MLLFTVHSTAKTAYITDQNSSTAIDSQALYFINHESPLSIDEILKETNQQKFKANTSSTANFGFLDAQVWVKITYFDQRSKPSDDDLVLEFTNPILDYIEIYRPHREGLLGYRSGVLEGYGSREIDHLNFLFYLPNATDHPMTVYLKITSETPLSFPLKIKSVRDSFASGKLLSNSGQLFISMLLLILFYNILLALSLRDLGQYYYVAWLFLATLCSSILGGVIQPYLGEYGILASKNLWAIGSFTGVSFLMHIAILLDIRTRLPAINKANHVLIIFISLNGLVIFTTDYRLWQWSLSICGLCGIIATLIFGYGIRFNHKTSALATIAFTPSLAGLTTYILASANIITGNWWTFNSLYLGLIITAIVVSLTEGNKLNQEKKKRYLLEQKNRHVLETNNALLTKSNDVKNAFLSTISHELRTPLNGAFATLSLLEESITQIFEQQNFKLPEDTHNYFNIMHKSNDEMIHLINGIIGFSELHDMHTKTFPSYFSPHDPIISIIELRRDLIANKNIDVHLGIDSLQPIQIFLDIEKYTKIMSIVFDNAIKFTNEGSITVRGSIEKPDNEPARLMISVKDTGVGIPASKIATITEPFSQVDQSYTRKYGGLGIGLAVCKKTLELLDGEMQITSEVDRGTCVQLLFKIPQFRANPELASTSPYLTHTEENAKAAPKETSSAEVNPATLAANDCNQNAPEQHKQHEQHEQHEQNVLIVEDNKTNQLVIVQMVKKMGLISLLAKNGEIAVEMVQKQNIDLILMDCQMPVMDGFEATRQIRKLSNSVGALPIIAVTANTSDEDRRKCRECGMDDFLEKPISYQVLSASIEKWLAKKTSTTNPPQTHQPQNQNQNQG